MAVAFSFSFFRQLGLDKVWEKSYEYKIEKGEILAKRWVGEWVDILFGN
jgi:hypothetical protein